MRRATTKPVKIRRQFNTREPQATLMRCPDGHEFGLALQKFYAVHGVRSSVRCPLCGVPTEIPKAVK